MWRATYPFSRFPRLSRSRTSRRVVTDQLLDAARHAPPIPRSASVSDGLKREISERSEESPAPADPRLALCLTNAECLTADDRRLGHDPGGFCAAHNRWLTWNEQQRGACSWCMPIEPEREPEYWASHWRRYTERR